MLLILVKLNSVLEQAVLKTGSTMTGSLFLNKTPTAPLQAATKEYVDSIATGLEFKESCSLATTNNLLADYDNSNSGVGATLTNSGNLEVLTIDGQTPNINERILIKDQINQSENGIYQVTEIGSDLIAWILTRSEDYDKAQDISAGNIIPVEYGEINSLTLWLQTDLVSEIGIDTISFIQFSYSPNLFLQVTNNLSDLSNATEARNNLELSNLATQTVVEHSILIGKQ